MPVANWITQMLMAATSCHYDWHYFHIVATGFDQSESWIGQIDRKWMSLNW